MRLIKTVKSATRIILSIEADTVDLTPIKNHVLGHFRRRVTIPGFRPGSAPLSVLEKHINRQELLDEFMEHAINQLYSRAVDSEKLRPVAQPEVALKQFVPFTSLKFEVDLQTLGQIRLPDYRRFKQTKKTPLRVTAKDVNNTIHNLQQRLAERIEVDRSSQAGDEVLIDFDGHDDQDQPVKGAAGRNYPLLLGAGTFIPGFEEHLIGAKAGQQKTFTLPFPKTYTIGALRGKKVTFTVKIKKVHELKLSKTDNAFAARVGSFSSIAELRDDVKKQIALQRQQAADRLYEDRLLKKIINKSTVDVPEALVDDQIQQMETEERRNLTYRGQTWQEHLNEEGITESEHRQRQRPEAQERVKTGLVLSEIANQEGIEVSAAELAAHIQALKSQHPDEAMQTQLDKPENQRDIHARLMTEKTIKKIVDYASQVSKQN